MRQNGVEGHTAREKNGAEVGGVSHLCDGGAPRSFRHQKSFSCPSEGMDSWRELAASGEVHRGG
jgi:hypothetical protein